MQKITSEKKLEPIPEEISIRRDRSNTNWVTQEEVSEDDDFIVVIAPCSVSEQKATDIDDDSQCKTQKPPAPGAHDCPVNTRCFAKYALVFSVGMAAAYWLSQQCISTMQGSDCQ